MSSYNQSFNQGSKYNNESLTNQNSLLDGEYDEKESAISFQEALKEWRTGGNTNPNTSANKNSNKHSTGMIPSRSMMVERSNTSVSGMAIVQL